MSAAAGAPGGATTKHSRTCLSQRAQEITAALEQMTNDERNEVFKEKTNSFRTLAQETIAALAKACDDMDSSSGPQTRKSTVALSGFFHDFTRTLASEAGKKEKQNALDVADYKYEIRKLQYEKETLESEVDDLKAKVQLKEEEIKKKDLEFEKCKKTAEEAKTTQVYQRKEHGRYKVIIDRIPQIEEIMKHENITWEDAASQTNAVLMDSLQTQNANIEAYGVNKDAEAQPSPAEPSSQKRSTTGMAPDAKKRRHIQPVKPVKTK